MALELSPATRWSSFASLVAVADRSDVGNVDLEDYVRVDLGARYHLQDHLSLELAVHNAFDENYQEIAGYGASGRLARFGARLEW